MVCEEVLEVNDSLVKKHACDATSKLIAKGLFNNGINGISDEVLSFFGVGQRVQVINVEERKW